MPTPLRLLFVLLLGLLGACSATRTITVKDKDQDLNRDEVVTSLEMALNSDGYRDMKEGNKSETSGITQGERNGGFAHWFGIRGVTKFNRDGEVWRINVACESNFGFSTLESDVADLTRQVQNTLDGVVKNRRTGRETTVKGKEFIEEQKKKAAEVPTPPATGRVYALVVGVVSNPGVGRVDKAADDAKQMGKLLEKQWGPKPEAVTVLVNEGATKEAILEALQVIEKRVQPGDTVVLYFGGNWRAQKGDDFDCYLPYDWKKGAPDKMKAMGLTAEEIAGLLKPGVRHVVFLNCNFVGSDDDSYYGDKGFIQNDPPLGQKLGNGLNLVFMPARPEKQTSWPRITKEHSPMVAVLTRVSVPAQQLGPDDLLEEMKKEMPTLVSDSEKGKVQPQLIMGEKTELKTMPLVPWFKSGP
jgi:hypothetical protein